MAFTGSPASASPYDEQVAGSSGYVGQGDQVSARLLVANFTYTHALAAGTGEINLVRLPPGKVHIFPELSYISVSQMVATADFHLGHRAYTQADGTVVAEDDNEWADNGDVGGGALAGPWTTSFGTGVGGTVGKAHADYDAADGLVIYVMIDTANIEVGDTIVGWVMYSKEN